MRGQPKQELEDVVREISHVCSEWVGDTLYPITIGRDSQVSALHPWQDQLSAWNSMQL